MLKINVATQGVTGVPIPCFNDFETFTNQLDLEALEDAKRRHYYKETTIEELFEEERIQFLKLPSTPYEVFKLSGATLNKYSEIVVDRTLFKVFNAAPNQTVLVKTYWDHAEILSESHQLLGKVNRIYTFNPQEVNWLDVFRNYAVKPRTYQYSQFKKMLPVAIQNYLKQEETLQKERLKAMYHWLCNYTITDIEQVLACSTGNETTLIISQDLSVYDVLTSKRGEKACH